MLTYWLSLGSPHLNSMKPWQRYCFISDVGAYEMYPVFVVGTTVAISVFEASVLILVDRVLRYSPRPGDRRRADTVEKLIIAIIALSIAAMLGAILLAIVDKVRGLHAHRIFLYIFMWVEAGYNDSPK